MYQQHFGLNAPPFELTPNTAYYFQTQAYREAMEVLQVALHNGEGFLKVTGEVGMGKTLLCRMLLEMLDDHESYWTVFLPNPTLTPMQLYQAVCAELEIDACEAQMIDAIHHAFIHHAQHGRQVVLLVDEAQSLSDQTLEALRLLGNLETQTDKLVHIILFGQPELNQRLAQNHLRQLNQRICFQYHLRAWGFSETCAYIAFRMQKSGFSGQNCFTLWSLLCLWQASGGVPRLISILAHKSLMLAYGQGKQHVSYQHVAYAVQDTSSIQTYTDPLWVLMTGILLCSNLFAIGAKWLL